MGRNKTFQPDLTSSGLLCWFPENAPPDNACLLFNPLSLSSHIFVLLISITEPRSLWPSQLCPHLNSSSFAAGEAGNHLGGEIPPAPKPWFSESAFGVAFPSTTSVVSQLLGWRDGRGWLWFRSAWCRALLLAAAPRPHEPCDEEMLQRDAELAQDALAKVTSFKTKLWRKRDTAYLRQPEGTGDRGLWKMLVQ